MPRMSLRPAWSVAAMLSIAGCSGVGMPTLPTPSPVSLAGTWSGPVVDAVSGDGTMHLALSTPAPNTLSGTWSAGFINGHSFKGPAVATLSTPTGHSITLFLDPPSTCTGSSGSTLVGFTLINVVVTSSRLTAVTARTSCDGVSFGTVSLSRQ